MYMRGVFLMLFVIVTATVTGGAVEVSGEITGSYGTAGVTHIFAVEAQQKSSRLDLQWALDIEYSLDQGSTAHSRWELQTSLMRDVQLALIHNRDHYTSSDVFRLINKNNYSPESYFIGVRSSQINLGLLRKVPLKNVDVVDAVFCESVLEVGPLAMRGTQLRFAGLSESGWAGVLQAHVKLGAWEAVTGIGWQTDSKGAESQGRVFGIKGSGPGFRGNLQWQRIDPIFQSPLAKTNTYTPNRQGWQLELTSIFHRLELGLNVRRHSNLDQSREYNQLSWKLNAKDEDISLEWRMQPTPAFILRYIRGDLLLQADFINSSLRLDKKINDVDWSLRLDGVRLIGRLECKLTGKLQWRVIGKYDFLRHRAHHSLLVQHRAKNGNFKLEIGQYDRGNISAGFGNSPSFCISWGWEF